jgi:hypothetical protein
MINPITYVTNWVRLMSAEATLNRYRHPGTRVLKLEYKPLVKRNVMNIIRIKINHTTVGMLIASQKNGQSRVTYIDYVWINNKKCFGIVPETESSYYQVMYDLFMQWHEDLVVKPWRRYSLYPDYPKSIKNAIAISINLTESQQIEKFRRILTLYGFTPNPALTLKDIDFHMPYREKEQIKNVVYTRYI